jgi:hypothetical protein
MLDFIATLDCNPPATASDVRAAEEALSIHFPDDYAAFVRSCNGAAGPIGDTGYIDLWPVTELAGRNAAYAVSEYAPNLVIFASDGGDTAYAFDKGNDLAIVETPFIGMGMEIPKFNDASFSGFLSTYGRS